MGIAIGPAKGRTRSLNNPSYGLIYRPGML
jgi:hypothetical protein